MARQKARPGFTSVQLLVGTRDRLNSLRRRLAAEWDRDVGQAELIARLVVLAENREYWSALGAAEIDSVDPVQET